MKPRHLVVLLTFLLTAPRAAWPQSLDMGSPAPPLDVTHWIKGEAIDLKKAVGKQITVIEFWATWCAPCIDSMPHLTKIQQKLGKKGVRVVGVTAQDPGNTLEKVRKMVSQLGDRIGYTIAFDGAREVYQSYMTAAGAMGIPHAFVVDKSGRIAWQGHPASGMDEAIDEMLAGTYDIGTAKRVARFETRLQEALMTGQYDTAVGVVGEILDLKPQSVQHWHMKFSLLAEPLGRSVEAQKCASAALKAMENYPQQLVSFASKIISDGDRLGCNSIVETTLKARIDRNPEDAAARTVFLRVVESNAANANELIKFARETLELVREDVAALMELAKTLTLRPRPEMFVDVALATAEAAIEADPTGAEPQMAKFQVLHHGKKDVKAATAIGSRLVEINRDDLRFLNNFAWNLLKEPSMSGKYNGLALAAAERMSKLPEGNHWTYLDTLAWAKYENGMAPDAVKIERGAIDLCDDPRARSELQSTLRHFESAAKSRSGAR